MLENLDWIHLFSITFGVFGFSFFIYILLKKEKYYEKSLVKNRVLFWMLWMFGLMCTIVVLFSSLNMFFNF